MRRTPFLSILGLALVATVPAAPAAGQMFCELDEPCTMLVAANVASVGTLQLGPAPLIVVDASALQDGFADASPALTFDVQTNEAWELSLGAQGAEWLGPLTATVPKPIEDLSWSTNGSTFTPVTLTSVVIASGAATASAAGAIDFRSSWDWDDPPGFYSAAVELTLSSP